MANATRTTDGLYNKMSRFHTSGSENGFIVEDYRVLNLTYTETFVRYKEANNPELISQRVFGDARYWWLLCRFNGFIDPNNIPAGTTIRIPDIQGIL